MATDSATRPGLNRWWRFGGGLSMNVVLGSLYAWSVFFAPLEQRFGWTRAETSTAFTIAIAAFATGFVLAGGLQDRFGPFWVSLTGGLLVSYGFFMELKSLFAAGVVAGGGSDHMQKIGSLRSINPYNPFLAMEVAITRRAKGYDRPLHPEEALSREQAIRFYTINNARLLFLEDRVGSLEADKQADFVVIDGDLLTCPDDQIKSTRTLATYLDGKRVFERRD